MRSWAVAAAFLAAVLLVAGARAHEADPATAPAAGEASPTGGATSDAGKPGWRTTYAGAVFRPQICLYNCIQANLWQNKYLMTYGVEVGDRYFGLAIRYGQVRRLSSIDRILRTVHLVAPDLRFHYDWRVGPVLLAPFLEFSPTLLLGGASGVHLILRPGFRATFLLARFLDLAVEPFALDIDLCRWERYASYSLVDLRVSLRYSVSISLHARW